MNIIIIIYIYIYIYILTGPYQSGAATPGQSGSASDGNGGVLHIPQKSSITEIVLCHI